MRRRSDSGQPPLTNDRRGLGEDSEGELIRKKEDLAEGDRALARELLVHVRKRAVPALLELTDGDLPLGNKPANDVTSGVESVRPRLRKARASGVFYRPRFNQCGRGRP